MINVIIADDHAVVRTGLKQILKRTTDIAVVAEAGSGEELLEKVRSVPADLVIQDMTLPGLSGLTLVKRLKEMHAMPVLVFSMHSEGRIASLALKAGASGYVAKDSDPEVVVSAIRKVSRGGKYIDPVLAEKIVFDMDLANGEALHLTLSARELQVFEMLVKGMGLAEISSALSLSSKTISTYKTRIMEKLGIENAAGLVRYAIEHRVFE